MNLKLANVCINTSRISYCSIDLRSDKGSPGSRTLLTLGSNIAIDHKQSIRTFHHQKGRVSYYGNHLLPEI